MDGGHGTGPAEAAGRYADLGAGAVLFTDVEVEGQLAGVRTEVVEPVVEAVDVLVIASCGVATIEDVRALKAADAAAVVVGSARYESEFTLGEGKRPSPSDSTAAFGTGGPALGGRGRASRGQGLEDVCS